MYEANIYMNVTEACAFLGIGRNTCLRLCQEQVHSFPAVKVGRRYQIDADRLRQWKNDWYDHKFNI